MGKQRSGTSMLMNMLHKNKYIEVFDEASNNPAFNNYQLKPINTIKDIIEKSKFKIVAFKPLADSHNVNLYTATLSNLKIIWCVRYYPDVANSQLKKFSNPNQAIRKVMEGRKGGGWFQEGISSYTLSTLNKLKYQSLSEFDLACLIWWARNILYFENSLQNNPSQCLLVKYEELVTNPAFECKKIIKFLGVDYSAKMIAQIHTESLNKNTYPKLNKDVEELCEQLWDRFNYV